MTGSHSDAQEWRNWIRGLVDSLSRLDGESGLEFIESAGIVLGRQLERHGPETGTVSEVTVAAVVVAYQQAAAEAYLDLELPRSEVQQILRDGLEDAYRQCES